MLWGRIVVLPLFLGVRCPQTSPFPGLTPQMTTLCHWPLTPPHLQESAHCQGTRSLPILSQMPFLQQADWTIPTCSYSKPSLLASQRRLFSLSSITRTLQRAPNSKTLQTAFCLSCHTSFFAVNAYLCACTPDKKQEQFWTDQEEDINNEVWIWAKQ